MGNLMPAESRLTGAMFAVPQGYVTHSDYAKSASIANHSTRAQVGSVINVPGKAGMMYTLYGVQIVIESTLVTALNTGGLIELENDGIDWKPTEIYTNTSTTLGAAGGLEQTPTTISLNKPLPAGSNIYVYWTSQNTTGDSVTVTCFWSTKPYSGPQTFIKSGISTALTSVSTATAAISIAIPANKGGKAVGFLAQVFGVVVTILSIGGILVVHNTSSSPSWEPYKFAVGSATCIASGGGEILVLKLDAIGDVPGNSTFTFDVTPISTNSQLFAACVVWEA